MKRYINPHTGLVLVVDGSVISVSEPCGSQVHTEKMGFGTPEYAARLAEALARDLGATEEKRVKA